MNQFRVASFLVLAFLCFAAKPHQGKSVLIIGDSISIGYTPFIKTALSPNVEVAHNPGNGGSTLRGMESMDKWLDNRDWDVIVFNFGLHDMVHKDSSGKYDVVNGTIAVPLKEYRKNLEAIADKLNETTAKVIFVTTTMVPEGASGRKTASVPAYNEVALKVMKKKNIQVVDLYQPSLEIHPLNSKPKDVHYTPKGYEQLASIVVAAIRNALNG
ncbi:MAG: SGNH/GDSL hydrolase family protein [bacterium]|jgi:lysophospholipase L1-like esterase